ncbi:MAG: hypothetical protein EOO03_08965, partial [Chitinophagaceae bacterium]
YYIFNVKESRLDYMSPEIKQVLGYDPLQVDVPFLLEKIHPDDQPWFVKFEEEVLRFFSQLSEEQILHYKVRYDYRIKKSDDTYLRVLQQVVTIQFDEFKGIVRTFGVHTDITHLKKEGVPTLSFIGMQGQPSYADVSVKPGIAFNKTSFDLFSAREREVLTLLIEGKSSEQIARTLFISKLTVDAHRKHLLQKAGCANTANLVSRAVREGWV